jgi:hypothetical protein
VKRICPNDPDATRKLKECEKAVQKIRFEEAISVGEVERHSIADSLDYHTIGISSLNLHIFLRSTCSTVCTYCILMWSKIAKYLSFLVLLIFLSAINLLTLFMSTS